MSYRVRGEVTVDVEDYAYNGDIEISTDVEGISELMSENNITTMELVDYQNEYGADEYRVDITDANIGEYIGSLNAAGVADLAERCVSTLKSRYDEALNAERQVRSDLAALKLKHIPTNDNTSQHSTTACTPASN